MDNYTATEIAYKNGYEQGKKDAVKHGRWVRIGGMAPPEYHGKHRCSLCYARALDRKFHEELSEYCPNCGAKMDGGTDDA